MQPFVFILMAYGVTCVLVLALVVSTWLRARRTRQQLQRAQQAVGA